nr:glutathione S-transferase U17-like [Tanacetum cinerariifolium]
HQILPKCPLARADNRFWATYIDNMLCPLYEELRQTPGKEGKDAVKKQFYEVSELLEGAYTKMSNGKAYFGGDHICYLDLVLGSLIPLTEFIEEINDFKVCDEVRTPGLARWAKYRLIAVEKLEVTKPRPTGPNQSGATGLNFVLITVEVVPTPVLITPGGKPNSLSPGTSYVHKSDPRFPELEVPTPSLGVKATASEFPVLSTTG